MTSFRCPQCGFINFVSAEACRKCKLEFAIGSDPAYTESYHSSFDTSYAQSLDNNQQNQSNSPPPPRRDFAPRTRGDAQNSHYKPKSGLAIASFVMGCLGFVLCWFTFGVLAIPGLVMGIVAAVKASKKPQEYGGKGFAIAGIILNGLFVLAVPIVLAIAIPNLLAARRAANEASAISSMRTLLGAEAAFVETKGGRCGDLAELDREKLIDPTLASGSKNGYKFDIAKKSNGICEISATPADKDGVTRSGVRSFYASTDEWEIRAADRDGAPAGKNDPMLRMLK